jgi:general secretion pathway protein L
MSAPLNQARFFGLDLGSFWRDLLTAWQGMLNWPAVSWLWPKSAVRLWLPTGDKTLVYNMAPAPSQNAARLRIARFDAVLIPESMLLRRTLSLPRLQSSDLLAALAIELQSLSPFEPDDLVWVHEVLAQGDGTLMVHIALTSRKLIERHVGEVFPETQALPPEVWISREGSAGFLMLAGFGEARRLRYGAAWRWGSAFLAMLVLALLAAIVVTPSYQLYLRTQQAHQAMSTLYQKVAPVLVHRESLARTTVLVDGLAQAIGQPMAPLQVLKLLTDVLPDDTYLWTLQVQGTKVSLTGQAANAAALMKQLDATPGISNVTAPTPATKNAGAAREQFAIEFTLNPALIGAPK